ncbi:MAG: eL32 family ribosomal protein [Candidatus Altiarchaeota archaeon]
MADKKTSTVRRGMKPGPKKEAAKNKLAAKAKRPSKKPEPERKSGKPKAEERKAEEKQAEKPAAKDKVKKPRTVPEPAEKATAETIEEAKKPEKKVKEKEPKPIEKIKYHTPRELNDSEKALMKKKPRFLRQEYHKLPRLEDKWRAPKGIDSKQIEGKRGKGKLPSIGYKKPSTVSGLVMGYRPVLVKNTANLSDVSSGAAVIISSSVGRKKRNEIIKTANERKIIILNPRKGEL